MMQGLDSAPPNPSERSVTLALPDYQRLIAAAMAGGQPAEVQPANGKPQPVQPRSATEVILLYESGLITKSEARKYLGKRGDGSGIRRPRAVVASKRAR